MPADVAVSVADWFDGTRRARAANEDATRGHGTCIMKRAVWIFVANYGVFKCLRYSYGNSMVD